MYLTTRDKFLELPEGTLFSRFYPELLSDNTNADEVRASPFLDFCVKGRTEGQNVHFTSLTDCLKRHDHPDDAKRGHMALCHGLTDSHFPLDVQLSSLDVPVKHTEPVFDDGREYPPRQLYAVWVIAEVDALVTRLQSARDHLRNSQGLEI